MTFLQLNSTHGVESIEHLFEVHLNCNFSKRQISVILLYDPARDFICSRWASPPINLVESLALGWPFTNIDKKLFNLIEWFEKDN